MRATRRYRPEHETELTWYDVSLVVVLNSTVAEAIISICLELNSENVKARKFLVSSHLPVGTPLFVVSRPSLALHLVFD